MTEGDRAAPANPTLGSPDRSVRASAMRTIACL